MLTCSHTGLYFLRDHSGQSHMHEHLTAILRLWHLLSSTLDVFQIWRLRCWKPGIGIVWGENERGLCNYPNDSVSARTFFASKCVGKWAWHCSAKAFSQRAVAFLQSLLWAFAVANDFERLPLPKFGVVLHRPWRAFQASLDCQSCLKCCAQKDTSSPSMGHATHIPID